MIELLRTTNAVRVSFLRQVLEDAEIRTFISDPGPWPGALPVRILVAVEDELLARQAIGEAEADIRDPD